MEHVIRIGKSSLQNSGSKKAFVAQLCAAMHSYLSENKPMKIVIEGDAPMKAVADALRNIAEMIDTAGSVVKSSDDDDDDEDPADWWKE
jgi:hypothetical protein